MKKIIIAIMLCAAVLAQPAPLPPAFFYGDAMVNGRAVPEGSNIFAEVDGEAKGTIELVQDGFYGSSTSDSKLGVTGWADDSGSEIRFFLELDGMQAIEAEQTAKWVSGKITELDLVFTGDEVPVKKDKKDDSPSSSSGSSSSRGSSSSGGTIIIPEEEVVISSSVEVQTASCYDIKAGEQLDIKVDDLALTRLQLLLTEDVSSCFSFTDSAEAEAVDAYAYFTIEADVPKDAFDTVIAKFKVSNSWFEDHSEDVMLMHFDDGWTDLETIKEGKDGTHTYFRAVLEDLGSFAIVSPAVENDGQVAEQVLSEEAEQEVVETRNSMAGITGAVIGAAEGSTYVLLASIVLLAGGISLFFVNRHLSR